MNVERSSAYKRSDGIVRNLLTTKDLFRVYFFAGKGNTKGNDEFNETDDQP